MKIKQVDGLQAELDEKAYVDPQRISSVGEFEIPWFYENESTELESSGIKVDDSGSGVNVFWTAQKIAAEIETSRKQILGIVYKDTSFSLALTDAGKYIRFDHATGGTCTVPQNSSVAFPVNTVITLRQIGAGQLDLQADTNVTLNGDLGTGGQHKSIQIIKVDTNIWDVIGGVEI